MMILEPVECLLLPVYDSTAMGERLIASFKLLVALVFGFKSRETTALALKRMAPK